MNDLNDTLLAFAVTGLLTCAGFLLVLGIREFWYSLRKGNQ
jgi:hypothetical protein